LWKDFIFNIIEKNKFCKKYFNSKLKGNVMQKILGLDLGSNSIGWAIRDTSVLGNQIIAKGVLAFEKGVATTKSGEEPKVKKRTESRGKRRNYQAEKYRKWEMLKCLIENAPQMCPLTINELNGWRKYDKETGRVYPQRKEFVNWLKLDFDEDGKIDFENPYHLRKIIAEKKIDNPLIIGRAFYHLVQKRGFRGRDEEESKTIMEGSKETGTIGADSIHKIMEEQNTTLGGALYLDLKINGKRARKRYNLRTDVEAELKTICSIQGIDENSELYKRLHKAIIWQRPLRTQKGNVGICTYERYEYIDKKNGSKHTTGKPRCPISHPLYEEYRAWCFINNIKIKTKDKTESHFEALSLEQRKNIYTKLFFRKSKPHFEFADIIKLIDPKKNTYVFNYKENVTISGCPISTAIKGIFGELDEIKIEHTVNEKRSSKKDYYDYTDVWHILFSLLSKDELTDFAKKHFNLYNENAEKFSQIKIQQGYASLSLCAIKKILPLLRKGFIYSDAVYLANLKKVLGRELSAEEIDKIIEGIRLQIKLHKEEKELIGISNNLISKHLNLQTNEKYGRYPDYVLINRDYKNIENELINNFGIGTWNEKDEETKNKYRFGITELYQTYLQTPIKTEIGLLFYKIPRLDEIIKAYLKNEWNAKDENLKYLYHPSETEMYPPAKEKDGKKYLGDPMPISRGFKNPMAMKTLHHLKRFINYLLAQKKIDENTRIVIEIARELNDANRRKAIERWQKEREKQNKEYFDAIKEIAEKHGLDIDPSKDDIIDKYRLWTEQERQCIYTGKVINCTELFDGTKFDFEHTIPADLSFDNELKNLTIADAKYNREIKKKRIPTELPNYENDATIGGEEYTAIRPRLKFIEEKVEHFEDQIEFWKKESKKASTKDRKDYCIQQKHYNQFELDYWKKKLNTFTIEEYKSSWRNSQLRDTQIITKYALPYLKTVFNKVEVQKRIISAEFRKIFNVGFEKDRSKHTHHAVDAAILTLIPSSVMRDKLLKAHFEAVENNIRFHSMPLEWKNYNPQFIKNIEEQTLVNHINQDRTLVPTVKYLRKRGKKQFVKERLSNGKWIYKRDEHGKKIPLIAQGDSIRGQLHEESLLGAIKEFALDNNGKPILQNGIHVYKKDKYGSDKLTFVKRIFLRDFTSIDDCKKIVDKTTRDIVTNTLSQRIDNGKSFKEAVAEDIWMVDKDGNHIKKDKHGNVLQPIRHVRCMVAAGRGFLTKEKALEIKQHIMPSIHEHKQSVYAKNDEMALCLYYEGFVNEKMEKAFKFIGLFELAQYRLEKLSDIKSIPEYQYCEAGRGRKKTLIPITTLITSGIRVLIYSNSPDEIKDLDNKAMLKRLYKVYKFNEAPVPYIYLQFHSEARPDNELGAGDTEIILNKYQPRLKLVANNFNCLVEGKDFEITIDGIIILK
jgi:CRISPR-associated endonuclease Csn1